jgi:hypothetical protein
VHTMTTANNSENNLSPWQPGQSGNPSGRPKGTRDLAGYVLETTDGGKELVDALVSIARGVKPNPGFYSGQLGLAAMIQQALARRPTGPSHQTRQRADDLGIAIPSTTERSWPVHKFQNFLGERSLLHNFPSGKA